MIENTNTAAEPKVSPDQATAAADAAAPSHSGQLRPEPARPDAAPQAPAEPAGRTNFVQEVEWAHADPDGMNTVMDLTFQRCHRALLDSEEIGIVLAREKLVAELDLLPAACTDFSVSELISRAQGFSYLEAVAERGERLEHLWHNYDFRLPERDLCKAAEYIALVARMHRDSDIMISDLEGPQSVPAAFGVAAALLAQVLDTHTAMTDYEKIIHR